LSQKTCLGTAASQFRLAVVFAGQEIWIGMLWFDRRAEPAGRGEPDLFSFCAALPCASSKVEFVSFTMMKQQDRCMHAESW
jgi:hypothetical protein